MTTMAITTQDKLAVLNSIEQALDEARKGHDAIKASGGFPDGLQWSNAPIDLSLLVGASPVSGHAAVSIADHTQPGLTKSYSADGINLHLSSSLQPDVNQPDQKYDYVKLMDVLFGETLASIRKNAGLKSTNEGFPPYIHPPGFSHCGATNPTKNVDNGTISFVHALYFSRADLPRVLEVISSMKEEIRASGTDRPSGEHRLDAPRDHGEERAAARE